MEYPRIWRMAGKLGIAAAVGSVVLLLAPSAALACSAKRGPHGTKKCSAASPLGGPSGCPTAKGESVTDWTDFNIPKGATGIKGDAKVSPPCQNSIQTTTLNVGARTDPDGSATNPPPGDKIAQVVVTETGTGPSTHNDALVDYDVTWTNARPLRILKIPLGNPVGRRKQGRHVIKEFEVSNPPVFEIVIYNPNPDDAVANLTDHLPRDFHLTKVDRQDGGECDHVGRELRCLGLHIRGGGFASAIVFVHGGFTHTGEFINQASATGRTVSGVQLPKSKEADVIFDIVKAK